MSRFVAVLDGSGKLDIAALLAQAERTMCAGGTRETAHRFVRGSFGLLQLVHHATEPPWRETSGELAFSGGTVLSPGDQDSFLDACCTSLRAPRNPLPPLPHVPLGRRALARWHADAHELVLVTEPNGHLPVFHTQLGGVTLLATEPKAVWAMTGNRARVDAGALAQLWTLGHCLGRRTLMLDVERLSPGTAYLFAGDAITTRAWDAIAFSEERRADADRLAQQLNAALVETLTAHRRGAPQVTSALSGGMDSRYVLAGALRVWSEFDSYTFGDGNSADARLASALAHRAGVANRRYVPGLDFLPRWAKYAAWRGDGLLSCVHAQGMDATIAHGESVRDVLNGIGGDFLMGAFLRPEHLVAAADPEHAARFILASRRFHGRSLDQILKPEVVAQLGAPIEHELRAIFELDRSRRLGNMLLGYWLRRYAPHITTVGLMLEEPWVEWIAPMIDPRVIAALADIPLEQRFMGRLYRRALTGLAPELTSIRWDRTGVAPRWPWPVHAIGRYGRRFGVLPRSRPAVDHAHALRTIAAPWLRETLLSSRARADGFLQTAFLEDIVDAHVAGRANHTSELGMALTLELWRRMFVDGERLEGNVGAQ